MSAERPATFAGLDSYKLTGVRVTDRVLGEGACAIVLELEYMGLKCAGKKIRGDFLRQGVTNYTVRRFEEECRLLSQIRHPNIVQFLGVYFQQEVQAPILVMEFLPNNLTSYIADQNGVPSSEISYSILYGVALGLCYLHSQTPPIIHRDLSSNNVLLAPDMTAKISDLGMARILNVTPLQVSRMTQTPGTLAYMPPEVMVADPKYNTSIDEFSYGIMMIHMFSGQWPEPQVGQIRTEPDGTLIPVAEAERRDKFLRIIGNDHPLIDLILKCISNHPEARPHASEIVARLAEMVFQFPASFANRLNEAPRQIEENRGLNLQDFSHTSPHSSLLTTSSNLAPTSVGGNNNLRTKGGKNKRTASSLCLQDTISVLGVNASGRKRRRRIEEEEDERERERDIRITWQQCAMLPIKLYDGGATVINSMVYYGGGMANDANDDDLYNVYCYDPSQDNWTTLPPVPVRYFGLGQVNGKLVAVGGVMKSGSEVSDEVYTYYEGSREWKRITPPIPTARHLPGVLSLQSALVVAGGCTPSYTSAVEIYKPDTSQWYKTNSLPTACSSTSLVAIGNTCYALGGFNDSSLKKTLCAPVDVLLRKAVPANQITHSDSSDTQSAWKNLPNTPTHGPAAAVLDGNLLAIGGVGTSDGEAEKKEVSMYGTNSWIYISDLPAPLHDPAAAVLSSTEVLVIGGWDKDTAAVYKGTLATSETQCDE